MLAEQKKSAWKHKEPWAIKKTQKNILAKSDNARVVGDILGEISQITQKLHLTTDVGRKDISFGLFTVVVIPSTYLCLLREEGAMGYGLPAAIGAWFAKPQDTINITGDGSFLMNMQEFLVQLDIKYLWQFL